MSKRILVAAAILILGLLPPLRHVAGDQLKDTYSFDPKRTVTDIGGDLRRALGATQRKGLADSPVTFNDDTAPAVRLAEVQENGTSVGVVVVTAGFIDLCRNVSHAKAIDTVNKGYFDKYIQILGDETGATGLKPLPDIGNPKYWSSAVMNEQQTNLRQMVGLVVGTKLAHHYLGHFRKYASRILDAQGHRTPINNIISPAEFEQALLEGTRLALDTGLGLEGCKALYDALGRMEKRPIWTTSFLPEAANVKALKRQMGKVERKFFGGDE